MRYLFPWDPYNYWGDSWVRCLSGLLLSAAVHAPIVARGDLTCKRPVRSRSFFTYVMRDSIGKVLILDIPPPEKRAFAIDRAFSLTPRKLRAKRTTAATARPLTSRRSLITIFVTIHGPES
jgi:hypothetical protein